jgi:hypothetical protein
MTEAETTLDAAVKKLRAAIEAKISALNATQMSDFASKVPDVRSFVQLRDDREAFFTQFSAPKQPSCLPTYSDELFGRVSKDSDICDLPMHIASFLSSELLRVKRIRQVVTNRCTSRGIDPEKLIGFAVFSDAIARHLLACELGLSQASFVGSVSFPSSDYLLELTSYFYGRKRTVMLKSFLSRIRLFPLTSRRSIFQKFFDAVHAGF